MANGHGGQRTPSNPAPVSGPGSLSQRTDGGPASQPPMVASGGPYGSRQEMEALQSSAPMAAGPAPIPLNAPTMAPDEPLTAGADLGPGISSLAAGITTDSDATLDQLRPLVRSLEAMANLPSATPETRTFVRALKARLAGRG